jgi:hypothetical protein
MSKMITHQPSVLIGAVPLFAVNRITLNESYELPPVGDKKVSQFTGKITRTVQVEATLIGDERHAIRLALEAMADLSRTLPAVSSIFSGIPLVAGLTTLLDMQVSSLNFSQSAEEKDVFTVSISLKHCPRPGVTALVSEGLNAATAIVGVAGLTSATPRRAG